MKKEKKPTSIFAILFTVSAICSLVTLILMIIGGNTSTGLMVFQALTALLLVIGIGFLILAGLGFIMTWGLWNGKNWARIITMILSGISVAFSLFSIPGSILSIIINLTILYYLTQPYIKEYYT